MTSGKRSLLRIASAALFAVSTLAFALSDIPRGEHQLQTRIIDSTGNVGSVSPSSTFYMWQASRLFPNRVAHH